MSLYMVRYDGKPYYMEAESFDDAIKACLAYRVAFENGRDGERPDEVVDVGYDPVIEAEEVRLTAARLASANGKLREEVGQLRAQLAAAVAEVNRLARDAGAYHNLRAEVLQRVREDVDAERRRRAAEMDERVANDGGPFPDSETEAARLRQSAPEDET